MAHATRPTKMKAKIGMAGPPYKLPSTGPTRSTSTDALLQDLRGHVRDDGGGRSHGRARVPHGRRHGGRGGDAVLGLPRRRPPRRPALRARARHRGGAGREGAGQPARLLPEAAQARDDQERVRGAARVEAARGERRRRRVGAHGVGRPRRRRGREGARRRLLDGADARPRLRARRRRRREPPVRDRGRPLRAPAVRRARVLLPQPQRRRHRAALRGRREVGAPRGSPRRSQRRLRADARGRPAGVRLQARRLGRLVRRGRSRQVRRQRRHRRVDAHERVGERPRARGAARAFADGKLNIPEHHNGVPDLARRGARRGRVHAASMQDPASGMVHQKVHDKDWTAPRHGAARGQAGALPLSAEHGRDAQPRRGGPAGRAALAQARPGLRRALQSGRHARLGGGPRAPDRLRWLGRRRRRAVRRPRRLRRALLGGRRDLRVDDGPLAGRSPSTRRCSARPTSARCRRPSAATACPRR